MFKENSWESVLDLACNELSLVQSWLDNNLLTLNIAKTKFLAFAPSLTTQLAQNNIQLHSCTNRVNCSCPVIKQEASVRYLGITIDENFKWNVHCLQTAKKLRKLIYKFVQLRQVVSEQLLRSVYFALVQSVVSYGITAWGAATQVSIDPVVKVQKLILRVIGQKQPRYPSEQLFSEYKVLDVRQMYIQSALLYQHKHPHISQHITHTHNTRIRETHLQIPKLHKTLTQRHIIYTAPKLFNLLPLELKLITHIRKYRREIYKWLVRLGITQTTHIFKQIIDT